MLIVGSAGSESTTTSVFIPHMRTTQWTGGGAGVYCTHAHIASLPIAMTDEWLGVGEHFPLVIDSDRRAESTSQLGAHMLVVVSRLHLLHLPQPLLITYTPFAPRLVLSYLCSDFIPHPHR